MRKAWEHSTPRFFGLEQPLTVGLYLTSRLDVEQSLHIDFTILESSTLNVRQHCYLSHRISLLNKVGLATNQLCSICYGSAFIQRSATLTVYRI